ncbi:MAG: biotin transporter BioY [Acidobacteriota bacterium]
MTRTPATTLSGATFDSISEQSLSRNVLLIIAASLLIALSARVAIPLPFTPVPMTLQPLAILLVGAALGAKRGTAAAILYLLEGAAGAPFFAHPLGLAGPTGGYLLAFPFGAAVAGTFADRGWMRQLRTAVPGLALALAVILLGGWAWLSFVISLGARGAFLAGVAPFLISGALNVGIAAAALQAAHRMRRRS